MSLCITGQVSPFSKLTLSIPPSKSHTMRALVFALMAKGKSIVRGALPSPDTEAMLAAIEQLGARVERCPEHFEIEGTGGVFLKPDAVIDAGNSGQVLRFIGALSALSAHHTVLTGDASVRKLRPIGPLLDALEQLGAHAQAMREKGHAPFTIRGPIAPGYVVMDGEDSQPVSALLMAAAFLPGPTEIEVNNPGEIPWIGFTLHWLKRFGIVVQHDRFSRYRVPGGATIAPFDFTVPGDFSSAAYPLVAALITGSELTLKGLDLSDEQGDKHLLSILLSMGADMAFNAEEQSITVRPSTLRGCTIDVNGVIDALPILAVVGCYAEGVTELIGAGIARLKESDRIHACATELKKMGACIEEREDGLCIKKSRLVGAPLFSHHDHRVALSLAVAALGARGTTTIEKADCIAKSYPTFSEHLELMGGA